MDSIRKNQAIILDYIQALCQGHEKHQSTQNNNIRPNDSSEYIYGESEWNTYKKLEQVIMEQTDFYHVLLENVVAGVFVVSDNQFKYVNSFFAQLLGYSVDEMLDQSVDQFLEDEDWLSSYGDEDLILKSNQGQQFRWRGKHKLNHIIYFEGNRTTLMFKGKLSYLSTVQDVTMKYKKDQELIQNAKMYQRMLMTIPEPIFITINNEIIFANRHGLDLLGKKEISHLMNRSIINYFVKEEQQVVSDDMQAVLHLEEATQFKKQRMKINGKVIDLEISSVKIDNYMGSTAILTVIRDLTERIQDEEKMIRSEKLSVIGQLAAGVAHEIRNPLTALKGFTQLLRTKYKENNDYFDIMATEIDRINLIVNEFMTLAKPHYNTFQNTDIVIIMQRVLSILDTQAMLLGIEVKTTFQQNLPTVYCNENQLKQVFLNIIKNAFEAMPSGGIVQVIISSEEQRKIHIKIIDQGIGMSDEVMKRIGEPFLTTKEKGTGLGLMVSSRIIEEHKGTIKISSSLGQGTLIDIQLPIPKNL